MITYVSLIHTAYVNAKKLDNIHISHIFVVILTSTSYASEYISGKYPMIPKTFEIIEKTP
jgi:hypothetical protein